MLLISRITDKLMTVGRPTHCTGTNSWTPGPSKTKSGGPDPATPCG